MPSQPVRLSQGEVNCRDIAGNTEEEEEEDEVYAARTLWFLEAHAKSNSQDLCSREIESEDRKGRWLLFSC